MFDLHLELSFPLCYYVIADKSINYLLSFFLERRIKMRDTPH
nr:MAG TPA: hypothetical protein [Caudoviricetes sp.]